ncbi:uncharacterized protein ATC70_007996 [Mucor velutinosus]|uniref:BZIP domain-containing protein n=1 Tax=Mucor velutinosus TaxID=708070 RepID=A0AAN7DPP3_9FUNG|nr:hypothetical protein ATC70_007996 [Mucor velutinosus]
MNTGYNTTASSSSPSTLFPPLNDANNSPPLDNSSEGGLLWSNVNTFAIPDDTTDKSDTSSTSSPFPSLRFNPQASAAAISTSATAGLESKEDSAAFNISWGGDDKPPVELHPEETPVEEPKLSRPLPKPRGIRRLPEPEPSADGTIDEDTLKRRKNTDAARRSRMKKFLKVDQLETKVNALQAENAKLTLSNAVLESEKRSLHAKENEYKKRIKYLEDIMRCNGWDFNTGNHEPW